MRPPLPTIPSAAFLLPAAARDRTGATGQRMSASILVVDDNQQVRELVRDTFLESGFTVLTAANGREALERVSIERPDLIITDVQMPVMDGWAFCEALKADPLTRDVPLVFLAGQREIPQRLRGLKLGAYDYLTKPFSTEELLLRAKLILDRTRHGAAGLEAPRTFLSGHTSHLPIADLIQLLTMNAKTGCLRLRRNGEAGRVHFRGGQVIAAFTARTRGQKAFYRVLGWNDADFHFDPIDDHTISVELVGNTQRLLMDALVALDDFTRLRADLPTDDLPLELGPTARRMLATPGDVNRVEYEALKLARDRTTLRELLDRLEAGDVEVGQAVSRLLQEGAIQPVLSGPDDDPIEIQL